MAFMIDPKVATLIFENQKVKVKIRKRINLRIAGVDFSLYDIGNKVTIPLWLAKVLSKEGVVELDDENYVRFDTIMKYLWREEHSPIPTELPEDFFSKISLTLQASLKDEENFSRLREKRQISLIVEDLLSSRLQKIFSAIRMNADLSEYYGKLTIEERILHDILNRLFSNWRKVIERLLKGIPNGEGS